MSADTKHKAYSVTSALPTLIYTRIKYLRSDNTTEVFEGTYKSSEVIIKIQYFITKSDLNRKQEEAALQRSTRHPNICKCLTSFIDETHTEGYKFVMIMERALKDIDDEITSRSSSQQHWSEDELYSFLSSLVEALAFMQENNMAHRDIKPANILIFPNNIVKLADFGLSIQEQDVMNKVSLGVVGTVMYLSPILLKAYDDIQKGKNNSGKVVHNPYKSDVFSLGLTFLYMASLTPPYGLNYNIEGTTYLHHKIQRIIHALPYTENLKLALSVMLEVEEDGRVDFIELLKLVKKPSENIVASFAVSEIPIIEEPLETPRTAITIKEIMNDPLLPIPIKSAISNVENSKSLILSHSILLSEAEYLKFAIDETNLTLLDLSECALGYKGLSIIFEADLSHVVNLSLGSNKLGRRGARILKHNLCNFPELKILRIWNNQFGDKGIKYIFQSISGQIEELFLAENGITDDGALIISRSMPPMLKILSLCDNLIGDKGARAIAVGLSKHENINSLYVDNNKIGALGVKYLISYLPATMKSLRMSGNDIPKEIIPSITAAKYKVFV